MRFEVSFGLVLLVFVVEIDSHGRLWEPPSRSSAFRRGFRTPTNYNDHECFCGGFKVMHQLNKGKCGLCGDAWNVRPPRPNEDGGKYGTKTIVRTYKQDKMINVKVFLMKNHLGYFEFHLCADALSLSEDCFYNQTLKLTALGQKKTNRLYIGSREGMISMKLQLPKGVQCQRCVLRWQYTTGNFWGTCSNGTARLGCGNQEVYRACADISIL